MNKTCLLLSVFALQVIVLRAQDSTSSEQKIIGLSEVTISTVRSMKGMGYLDEVHNGIIYSGKKTEVIITDSIDANTALNNPRQVMGRIPGAVFSETLGSGFPSNGVGFRGLNPSQSVETNTRMNGYSITADLYGYPESYFLPNLEAVQRIEVIRGASSLQFGPQFGGVINYIIRDAPDKKFEFTTQQTTGSFGMFNSFNTIGGKYKWFSYYGYFQYTHVGGWRPNSKYSQFSGFAKVQFAPTENLRISLEYSALRNKIQMPGGLSDDQYAQNIRASYRARNWMTSPWSVAALKLDYKISKKVSLNFVSSFLASGRNVVWKNEDGGPQELDLIDSATFTYGNRELGKKTFWNTSNELHITANYRIGKTQNTVSGGIRFFYGKYFTNSGEGTIGSDFDLTLVSPRWKSALQYFTLNVAPYIENIFRVTDKFSIVPGFRFEYLNTKADGYKTYGGSEVSALRSKSRYIPLAGIGLQYRTTETTSVYGNFTQCYSPFTYSQLTVFGTTSVIDPNMKDASGFNADLGFRGTVKNFLSFDIGAFYLQYNHRIGLMTKTDSSGTPYNFRTNIANSRHVGAETYVEINPVKAFTTVSKYGTISFFNSFTFIDARYMNGIYKNNFVENAPRFINRFGTTYAVQNFSITLLVSHTSKCFSDAGNTFKSDDAVIGIVPAYNVIDLSATYKFLKHFNAKVGMNNVANAHYFTMRADEYPGPGIIPAIGRSFYIGVGAKF